MDKIQNNHVVKSRLLFIFVLVDLLKYVLKTEWWISIKIKIFWIELTQNTVYSEKQSLLIQIMSMTFPK